MTPRWAQGAPLQRPPPSGCGHHTVHPLGAQRPLGPRAQGPQERGGRACPPFTPQLGPGRPPTRPPPLPTSPQSAPRAHPLESRAWGPRPDSRGAPGARSCGFGGGTREAVVAARLKLRDLGEGTQGAGGRGRGGEGAGSGGQGEGGEGAGSGGVGGAGPTSQLRSRTALRPRCWRGWSRNRCAPQPLPASPPGPRFCSGPAPRHAGGSCVCGGVHPKESVEPEAPRVGGFCVTRGPDTRRAARRDPASDRAGGGAGAGPSPGGNAGGGSHPHAAEGRRRRGPRVAGPGWRGRALGRPVRVGGRGPGRLRGRRSSRSPAASGPSRGPAHARAGPHPGLPLLPCPPAPGRLPVTCPSSRKPSNPPITQLRF